MDFPYYRTVEFKAIAFQPRWEILKSQVLKIIDI